jgi:hypothetical protein
MGHSPSAGCWAQAPPPAHAIPIMMQPAPNARPMLICFPEKTVFVLNAKNETAL